MRVLREVRQKMCSRNSCVPGTTGCIESLVGLPGDKLLNAGGFRALDATLDTFQQWRGVYPTAGRNQYPGDRLPPPLASNLLVMPATVTQQCTPTLTFQRESSRGAGLMQKFDLAKHGGITREHFEIFQAVATERKKIILLRPTNRLSLKYIGQEGFVPKPLDVKPKTADGNRANGGQGGLVVDPTLFVRDHDVFGPVKKEAALEVWASFLLSRHDLASAAISSGGFGRRVFPRHQGQGFFAVNTDPGSLFFGCLMVSKCTSYFSIPGDWDLSDNIEQKIRQHDLKYIYGDYDLFGVIDQKKVMEACRAASNIHSSDLVVEQYVKKTLYGNQNFTSPEFEEIKGILNQKMKLEMIQHGSQDNYDLDTSKEDLIVIIPQSGVKRPPLYIRKGTRNLKQFYEEVFLIAKEASD